MRHLDNFPTMNTAQQQQLGNEGGQENDPSYSNVRAPSLPLRKAMLPSISSNPCHVKQKHAVKLSESIINGTKKVHKEAENVYFIRSFIKGNISRDAYAKITGNLWHVYVMLEAVLDKNEGVLYGIHQPVELDRADRLLKDWRFLAKMGAGAFPEASPATKVSLVFGLGGVIAHVLVHVQPSLF